MAKKTYMDPDNVSPSVVMDGDTGLFTQYGRDGSVVLERPLTDEELGLVNLPEIAPKVHDLTDVVDQLILDALMNSMGM